MKDKWLIISILVLLSASAASLAEENQIHEEQLEQIEAYISQLHSSIDDYYAYQLAEVQFRLEAELRLLQVADKACFSTLAAQAEVAHSVLRLNSYTNSPGRDFPTVEFFEEQRNKPRELRRDIVDILGISPQWFAETHTLLAQAVNQVLDKYEPAVLEIETQKRYALTVELPELEARLKANLIKPRTEPTRGVVTGIVYTQDNPTAIIEGKVVHQGETIHGTKVLKIEPDKVLFASGGARWQQKVHQQRLERW